MESIKIVKGLSDLQVVFNLLKNSDLKITKIAYCPDKNSSNSDEEDIHHFVATELNKDVFVFFEKGEFISLNNTVFELPEGAQLYNLSDFGGYVGIIYEIGIFENELCLIQ